MSVLQLAALLFCCATVVSAARLQRRQIHRDPLCAQQSRYFAATEAGSVVITEGAFEFASQGGEAIGNTPIRILHPQGCAPASEHAVSALRGGAIPRFCSHTLTA